MLCGCLSAELVWFGFHCVVSFVLFCFGAYFDSLLCLTLFALCLVNVSYVCGVLFLVFLVICLVFCLLGFRVGVIVCCLMWLIVLYYMSFYLHFA